MIAFYYWTETVVYEIFLDPKISFFVGSFHGVDNYFSSQRFVLPWNFPPKIVFLHKSVWQTENGVDRGFVKHWLLKLRLNNWPL